MKKLFLLAAVAVGMMGYTAQANAQGLIPGLSANPMQTLACGIPLIPIVRGCTPLDHVVGGAIDGAALGFGVGAVIGAGGAVIANGGAFAGAGTASVAWAGAGLGALLGTGVGVTTGYVTPMVINGGN